MCMLLLAFLCSFFWGCFFQHWGQNWGPCTPLSKLYPSYILHPVSLHLRQLSCNKRDLCFSSMQFLIPPAGGALFSLWTASLFFWMSYFVTPSCHCRHVEQCAVCHTLTLAPQHRALCHRKLERKSNSIQHNLGLKEAVLPSISEKS